ncbi:hypothetical protein BJI47_18360 [Rhodococcus sp. 1168]|nr:hypothetical protein BJI47_18360 [Rhodococcus sp. 1168]
MLGVARASGARTLGWNLRVRKFACANHEEPVQQHRFDNIVRQHRSTTSFDNIGATTSIRQLRSEQ